MTGQLLLHPELNIVREELILLLEVHLTGAHASLLTFRNVFLLNELRSHNVVNTQRARFRRLLRLLRVYSCDMANN